MSVEHIQKEKEMKKMCDYLMKGATMHFKIKPELDSVRKYFDHHVRFYLTEKLKVIVYDTILYLEESDKYMFEGANTPRIAREWAVELLMKRWEKEEHCDNLSE